MNVERFRELVHEAVDDLCDTIDALEDTDLNALMKGLRSLVKEKASDDPSG